MTGPLAFASSDISPKDAGYLDAAIISGLRAAAKSLASFSAETNVRQGQ